MCAAFDTTALSTEFLAIFNKHSSLMVEKFNEVMKTEDEFDVYPHILHASVHMILGRSLKKKNQVHFMANTINF